MVIKKIKFNCDNCGERCSQYLSQYKKKNNHFCNSMCQYKYRFKQRIKIKCDSCGKYLLIIKYKLKNNKYHFCNTTCRDIWQSKYRIGEKHPNWRGGKILVKCDSCNKPIYIHNSAYKQSRYHFCSTICRDKYHAQRMIGNKNPSYTNGTSGIYSPKFNKQFKEFIRKRDNYQCQYPDCKITQKKHFILNKQKLSIHHIDYDKNHADANKSITLCKSCNGKVNKNKDYWFAYFSYMIEDFYKHGKI